MDHHEQFRRAAIERGFPEDEVGRFAKFLRFAIRASRRPAGGVVGQYGGLPRLPVGVEWPSSGSGPLPFIASFDCAALPRVSGLALPVDGSLLFFLDRALAFNYGAASGSVAGEQQFARVLHVPAGASAAPAEAPAGLDSVSPQHDLFATVTAELPFWFDGCDDDDPESTRTDNGEHLARDLQHLDRLCALAKELRPRNTSPDVYLGGYNSSGGLVTDYMDETPETQMADDNLKARQKADGIMIAEAEWDLRLEEETLRVMREWIPLAQFAKVDAYWGCFMIRHEDLAARRFDKALSRTEFTE
ncbi:DUF1963 domain-containing protein [Micromonospora sp. LH3U1]|uniref:DUF1963 domain-containing protein n=1 Tax=Micromonospora sp. LH3U1 TaxID=3018339 RepID=UPI00234A8ACA|nr:DUF1963 domain-containing protein [Micromonospora sp. LH3U1]WCN83889.1 DUF1963 domain-containing protein [Micromonospora sp. LH3U1]